MRFAHGRWDREQPHVGELKYDGRHCWFECTCGEQGPPRASTAEADVDADTHERYVFDVRRAGKRLVRGGVE